MLPLPVYEIKIMGFSVHVPDEVTYKNQKMKARATLNAANTMIKTKTLPAMTPILPAILGIPNK